METPEIMASGPVTLSSAVPVSVPVTSLSPIVTSAPTAPVSVSVVSENKEQPIEQQAIFKGVNFGLCSDLPDYNEVRTLGHRMATDSSVNRLRRSLWKEEENMSITCQT